MDNKQTKDTDSNETTSYVDSLHEISKIDVMVIQELKKIDNKKKSNKIYLSDDSDTSKKSSLNLIDNNVIKIITTDKLKNIIDSSSNEYYDEEEEYCNKIGVDKAAQLFDLQEKLDKLENTDTPLRYQILESYHPEKIKSRLLKMYNTLSEMNMNGEYYKNLNWIEGVLKIPFNKYSSSKNFSPENTNLKNFLIDAQKILDKSVFGHKECKEYILQIIAQHLAKSKKSNLNSGMKSESESESNFEIPVQGRVFGIQGPPGNGKTSLIKNGICQVLNRPFSMIALGGISDGSLLDGHDFTYEGSRWGRLVQCLMDAKCMDPVIYFDELDKVSETYHGDEIIGVLTHLVDFTQNDKIQDKYFNGIDLDFSRCIFIFSFNDESKINNILKDRIQIFYTSGFSDDEKVIISKDYILPQICTNFTFSHTQIYFSPDTLKYLIKKYTNNDEGVRDLKKKIELILLKYNYDLILDSKCGEYPHEITVQYIDNIFTNNSSIFKNINDSCLNLYI